MHCILSILLYHIFLRGKKSVKIRGKTLPDKITDSKSENTDVIDSEITVGRVQVLITSDMKRGTQAR